MKYDVMPLTRLIEQFARLPGIGRKTAQRLAFYVLNMPHDKAKEFADTILEAHEKIRPCAVCQNLTDREVCQICSDPARDHSMICVVEGPRDVMAIERTKEYQGLYHVLHGLISPMNQKGPDDLTIRQLSSAFSKAAYRRSSWQPTQPSKEKPPLCTSRDCSNPSGSR